MSIGKLYENTALLSPRIEVLLRKLYWNNVHFLSKFSVNKTNRIHRTEFVDFEEIVAFLKESGIKEGDLIILHSSYGNLKPISLDNKGIIDRLLELVGPTGTLAAPVIRRFDEEKGLSLKDKIRDKITTIHCTYDVENTPVSSGVLCSTLMQHENSVTSLFPLNPLTSVGPLARDMIKGNLDENFQSAHGPRSCWKFCADNNAIIVYIGVNYGHHITMQQVVTECYNEMCPPNFYHKRKFTVINKGEKREVIVKERKQIFTKFLAEMNVNRDLRESGIVKNTTIKGIPIAVIKSMDLIDFYRKKGPFYPYYIPKRDLKQLMKTQ